MEWLWPIAAFHPWSRRALRLLGAYLLFVLFSSFPFQQWKPRRLRPRRTRADKPRQSVDNWSEPYTQAHIYPSTHYMHTYSRFTYIRTQSFRDNSRRTHFQTLLASLFSIRPSSAYLRPCVTKQAFVNSAVRRTDQNHSLSDDLISSKLSEH